MGVARVLRHFHTAVPSKIHLCIQSASRIGAKSDLIVGYFRNRNEHCGKSCLLSSIHFVIPGVKLTSRRYRLAISSTKSKFALLLLPQL